MTPLELRNSILQYAIQGNLVEQREEEGTGEELYQQIQAEKQKLIKEGKIKKEKPIPEITEDEIPFEIPAGWHWTRLSSLCSLISDGTHKTPRYVEKGIPFLSVKDISSGHLDFSDSRFITQEEHLRLTQRCKPELGDVLICRLFQQLSNYLQSAACLCPVLTCDYEALLSQVREYLSVILNAVYADNKMRGHIEISFHG